MMLDLPAYLPDQASLGGGLELAENVYPHVGGYGPVGSLATMSDALGTPFAGGASFIAGNGLSSLLVGASSGVFKYSSGSWSALLTGMSVSGHWRFVQFGDVAVAVNGVATKAIDLSAGTVSDITGAPAGIAVMVVGDYVVIGQNTGDLLGIYTSGFNTYLDWNPAGLGGATIQPMLTGGEVMGLAGGEYGVILQRQRIVRMTRTGDSTAPFQYDQITDNVGCSSKGSVAQAGRSVFFLSDRGFMALDDGQSLKPIGSEKVDRTFQASVSRDDYESIFAAVDPQNKLVVWCVPGNPGRLWIYNFELDRWTTATVNIDGIFAGFTSSLTLEAVSALYPNIDTMPYPLDDPRFSGGAPRFYGITGGELATFTGQPLQANLQLSFQDMGKGRVARVRSMRPVSDTLSCYVSLDCRARLGDAPNLTEAQPMRASGATPIRASGRYQQPALSIPAGAPWTFVQSIEIDYEVAGER